MSHYVNVRPIINSIIEMLNFVLAMMDINEAVSSEKAGALYDELVKVREENERLKAGYLIRPASTEYLKKAVHGWMAHEPKKIEAIKFVRDVTGMGLKESKEFVEAQMMPAPPEFFPKSGSKDYWDNLKGNIPDDD